MLQALKELNFVLANRAPELSAHYGIPLELQQVSAEEVPDFVTTYLTGPLPTLLSIAVEGDHRPGVANITDIIDSPHHYRGIINKQVGQIHVFILIQIELIIILVVIIEIDAIQVCYLITSHHTINMPHGTNDMHPSNTS